MMPSLQLLMVSFSLVLMNNQVFSHSSSISIGKWTEEGQSCYLHVGADKKWGDAQKECATIQNGAHLMYIGNSLRTALLKPLIMKILNSSIVKFPLEIFVGASKNGSGWFWGNGSRAVRTIEEGKDALYLGMKVLKTFDITFIGFDKKHKATFICQNSSVSSNGSSASPSSPSLSTSPSTSLSASPSPSPSPSPPLTASPSLSASPSPSSSTRENSLNNLKSSVPSSSTQKESSSPLLSASLKSALVSSSPRTTPISASPVVSSSTTSSVSSSSATSTSRNDSTSMLIDFMRDIESLDVKDSSSINRSIQMMDSLLSNSSSISLVNIDIMNASKILEEFALKYFDNHWNTSELIANTSTLVLQAKKMHFGNGDYKMIMDSGTKNKFEFSLPRENFYSGGTTVLSIYYKNLERMLPKLTNRLTKHSQYELKSKIVSIAIKPSRKKLAKSISILLSTQNTTRQLDYEGMCVFWKFKNEGHNNPGWSREGCTVVKVTDEYVECSCNHLTQFAVLMQVKEVELSRKHVDILTILTNVGLSLSILGCILTFLAYYLFTDIKSEQSQIRMNLVFCLGFAHVLFLLGVPAQIHIVFCVGVAALAQFFYTSALCWMFVEGIKLYLQVVKVFNTTLKMRRMYGFTSGFPILLIICSLSIAGNDSDGLASFVGQDYCWLSVRNNLVWTFVGPVILIILGNLVILGLVFKEMVSINKPVGITHNENTVRSGVKALFVLSPILGVTWLVGLLSILGTGIVGSYIFTILNSLQGLLIFIFHCLKNTEIQGKFRRRIHILEESRAKDDDSFRGQTTTNKKSKTASNTEGNYVPPTATLGRRTKKTDSRFNVLTIADI